MEDVLSVYHRPYDEKRPVVCLDEQPKSLRCVPRGSLPISPGNPKRVDYEYERLGTCNVFLTVEPLGGIRRARVTARRRALDFAEQLRLLVDEDYPDAEKVVLVTDNLNIHTPACLYDLFKPKEAYRIAQKIEWHYTPEHGSWLNVAEIELSILTRQCLSRQVSTIEQVRQKVGAWQQDRNQDGAKVNWQFTTQDARIKLRRLYPTLA
jgi:hypothetical protein